MDALHVQISKYSVKINCFLATAGKDLLTGRIFWY